MRINRKQEVAMWVFGLIGCLCFAVLALDKGEEYALGILAIFSILVILSLRDRG
jgi:hypothetical protein